MDKILLMYNSLKFTAFAATHGMSFKKWNQSST